jgi:Family of unknown function (DUF6069)
MGTATTITSTVDPTRRRTLLREAEIGAGAAAAVNATIWGVGRVAGVSFHVRPQAGGEVGIVLVVLTTLVLFSAGMWLFALAARRSDRLATVVLVAGVLFAVASTGGALWAAEDSSTAALLAAMHLVTGAAFAITAWRARRRAASSVES